MQANIPNINDGDAADDSLWNSRFAEVAKVLAGNIEADNVKDGSLPYSKLSISDGAIPNTKMPFPVTLGTNSGTAGGSNGYFKLGEFLVIWGTAAHKAGSTGGTDYTIIFPVTFAANPTVVAMPRANADHVAINLFQRSHATTSTATISIVAPNTSGGTTIDWVAIGKAGS